MYLLDTDYLIDFLKGVDEVKEIIDSLKTKKLFTSVVCVAEVLEGIYNFQDIEALKSFEKLLNKVKVLDVDLMIATNYAVFRGNLRKVGKLIDKFDLLIASTCFAHKLVLVTENREHFKRVPGLKMYKHKN